MEAITKFKAIDGKEFDNEKDCLSYELLIEQVAKIMSKLPPLPDDVGCDFTNGHGFIKHNCKILRSVKVELLELMKTKINHHWIQQSIDNPDVHTSWVGRLVGDYDITPLRMAWSRFECVDKLGREWGQPYFANNPDKGKQVCVAAG